MHERPTVGATSGTRRITDCLELEGTHNSHEEIKAAREFAEAT